MNQSELIWHNGEFVAWEDAKVHVLTHGLHYGTGVFEGIRCYETDRGPAIFRHLDHLDRLERSAKLYYMDMPFTSRAAARRDARADRAQRAAAPATSARSSSVATGRWGSTRSRRRSTSRSRRGSGAPTSATRARPNGIRAKVSSWERISPRSLIPHAKASGQYLNSVLAKIESLKAGYDEAILLDDHGHVCEGSGENIYIVRDGVILTPPQTASILDGISRRAVLQIARDLGYPTVERDIARAELYMADEVFLTGTAAELVPGARDRRSRDRRRQARARSRWCCSAAFDDALHGRSERYSSGSTTSRCGSGRAPDVRRFLSMLRARIMRAAG